VNLVEATDRSPILNVCELNPRFLQTKMEMTMRKKILTLLVVPLLAALSAQAAVASERHHARTKGRTVAIEQFRNSNAFAAPSNIAAAGNSAAQSYLSSEDEGAMTSGIAGH
jgi:hypothetical protein